MLDTEQEGSQAVKATTRFLETEQDGSQAGKAGEVAGRELNSVSPGSEMTTAEGMSNNMATSSASDCSSQSSSIQLSQLYQDFCDQKDVIMSCLEEDNCDIDQVFLPFLWIF